MLHPEILTAMAAARRAEDLIDAGRRHTHPVLPRPGALARAGAVAGLALMRAGEALLRRASSDHPETRRTLTARAPQGT